MKLTRRSFLRLLGVSSLASVLAACGIRNKTRITMEPDLNQPSSTPKGGPSAINIAGGDADVWAWKKQITGTIEGETCDSVVLQANGETFQALLQGKAFSADLPLVAEKNSVTATCLPGNTASASKNYDVRLLNVPESNIQITIQEKGILLDASGSKTAPLDGTPIRETLWLARPGNPASVYVQSPADAAGKTLDQPVGANPITLAVPETDGEYYIQLVVKDENGREDMSTTYFVVEQGKPRLDDWSWQNTAWVESAVVYGIIPRNFGNKGFKSIAERLDVLQALGINAIWLAPIHPSPAGDYGYAVKDYFELNERYGTKADFHSMVQEAHKHGIRVLMDFVPNHSSIEHPYYEDTLKYGEDSHYWTFYDRDAEGKPTHYFNWTKLPNLNYANPEVEAWMTEAFAYWVREFDVDGFRVDVAWGIRERQPDYWPKWRQTLKRIKPDLLLLAEASARDPYYFSQGFDAAYDWTSQLGRWAWDEAFDSKPNLLTYNLNAALTNSNNGYDADTLIFRFLNNNDTERRFISKYGIGLTRAATTMLLTLPGIPCIYTGDEVGSEFLPYGDPQPLSFEDKLGLFDFHKNMIRLRLELPALHSRKWIFVEAEPHTQVIAYLRLPENDGDGSPALVVLNLLDESADLKITMPEGYEEFLKNPLIDQVGQERFEALPEKLQLQAYQTLILTGDEG